jgi:hypothetical protein
LIIAVFSEMCTDPYAGDVKSLRGIAGALRRRLVIGASSMTFGNPTA